MNNSLWALKNVYKHLFYKILQQQKSKQQERLWTKNLEECLIFTTFILVVPGKICQIMPDHNMIMIWMG